MKLLSRAVLGSILALSVGVAVVPLSTFAATSSVENPSGRRMHHDHHRMGAIGDVVAITPKSDGMGTISLKIAQPPTDHPAKFRAVAQVRPNDLPVPGSVVEIPYDQNTKFVIDGKESSVSNVSIGTRVRIVAGKHGDETYPAKLVTTKLPSPKKFDFMGTVSTVNTSANTMMVSFRGRGDKEAVTVNVVYSDSTSFAKNHDAATESSLIVGAKVHFDGKLLKDDETISVTDVTKIDVE